ncbi:MAG: hypothetical protein HFJ42_01265 [Clostridia bacterium]|nr:hypothetical protein [Clostridia bacterium]
MMKKEELNELLAELKDICRELSDDGDLFENLMRLTVSISKLKDHPIYSKVADKILSQIQACAFGLVPVSYVICDVELLIVNIDKDLKKDSITTVLKNGCQEAKAKIDSVIPEEVKGACKATVCQLQSASHNVEKKLKSKIKNWLLSDDE